MKKIVQVFCVFILSTTSHRVLSQDPHFSQFYSSPLLLNPATTGVIPGDVRIVSHYRNQWKSVSTPFTTAAFSLDAPAFNKLIKEQDIFGLGIVAMTDQSNNGGLKANFVTLSMAYNKTLDYNGNHMIGLGYQFTFATKKVDYNKFVFSRQFTPNGFDPQIPNGEPINGFQLNYQDYATGILYSGMNYEEHHWYLGSSYYHFTRPNESISGEVNRLDPRITIHGGYSFPISELNRVYLSALYMNSALANEITGGVVFESTLNSSEYETSIYTGVFYRRDESIIPHFGINTGKMKIGLSYDINISSFKTATQGRGGFEMSLALDLARSETASRIPKCYFRF